MVRTRKVIRCARVCLTWLVVVLLTFDVGSACSVLYNGSGGCGCRLVTQSISFSDTGCGIVFTPTPRAPVRISAPVRKSRSSCHDCFVAGCDGICGGNLSDCCGGDGVVISECGDGGIVDYSDEGTDTESDRGSIVVDNVAPIVEAEPDLPADAPVPLDLVPKDVAPMPRTADDLIDDLKPEVTDDTGLDDLFNDDAVDVAPSPAGDAPAAGDSIMDDLFNDRATDAVPADAAPAADDSSLDDLFNDAATDTVPADTTPAADDSSLDDLFNDAAPSADDDSSLDDLFNDAATDAVPADATPAAADDSSLDDLFNDAATDAIPADTTPATDDDSSLDDLFDDAAADAVPADTTPAADDDSDIDNLFNDAGSNQAPAEGDDLDDLFSSRHLATTRPISFVAREDIQPLRAWLDNTGQFRTVGRLVVIGEDHIRLRKPNGRVCTVPFDRLSTQDVDYVRQQAKQHAAALKVAARDNAN